MDALEYVRMCKDQLHIYLTHHAGTNSFWGENPLDKEHVYKIDPQSIDQLRIHHELIYVKTEGELIQFKVVLKVLLMY